MNSITPLPSGFVLHSKHYQYTIKDVLGSGSNGIVYLSDMFSSQDNTSCSVALKEWAPEKYCQRMRDMSISYENNWESEYCCKRFINEHEVLSTICHQNVVTVYECFKINGTYYYSMEYLPEGTLLDRLISTKMFNEEQSLFVIKQIANGLEVLHQKGYIHSDLQLKNIAFRNCDFPVLIDGGAYEEDGWRYVKTQDVWALANVLLCLLSGEIDAHSIYTQSERMLAIAKDRSNMTENTEKALRMAFSAEFQQVSDFINALEGHYKPSLKKEQVFQMLNENIVPIENNPHKAIDFLGTMERTPQLYICKEPVDIKELGNKQKPSFGTIEIIKTWFLNIQEELGFVLGL